MPRGQVALHKTSDGVSERQKEIYGTPVKTILPISATTYNPKPSLAEVAVKQATRPSSTFLSSSGRKLWIDPPNNPSPLDYSPMPQLVATRPPTAFICSEERQCNSPVRRDPMPELSPNATYSQRECSPLSLTQSSRKPNTPRGQQSSRAVSPLADSSNGGRSPRKPNTPGAPIGKARRHLNIHNLNSGLDHSRDPDYDNPAPGSYEARSPDRHKEFSVMRGMLNGTRRL